MTSELKKAVGRTISPCRSSEAQTIEQIAELLREGPARNEWKTLVPIKPTGSRRPFFLVTRPNANSLGYIALARRLDPDQPVYGLQFQYPEEAYLGRPYTRRVRRSRALLRGDHARLPARGPYLLGGMCEGSLLAFVMTRQLEAAGQEVAFLGMMDAWPEENTRRRLMNWVFMYDRKLRGFLAMSPPKKKKFLLQTVDRLLGRAQGNLGSAAPRRRGPRRSRPRPSTRPRRRCGPSASSRARASCPQGRGADHRAPGARAALLAHRRRLPRLARSDHGQRRAPSPRREPHRLHAASPRRGAGARARRRPAQGPREARRRGRRPPRRRSPGGCSAAAARRAASSPGSLRRLSRAVGTVSARASKEGEGDDA